MSSPSDDKRERELSSNNLASACLVSALCFIGTILFNPPIWIHNYLLLTDQEAEIEREDC